MLCQKLETVPIASQLMKSVCSKIACREEDGSKPKMILPNIFKPSKRKNVKRKLAVDLCETSSDSEEDSTDDEPD